MSDNWSGWKIFGVVVLVVIAMLGWILYLDALQPKPDAHDPDVEIDYWSARFYRCEANYDALNDDLTECEIDLRSIREKKWQLSLILNGVVYEALDITPYYVAWGLCVYDRNCSACLKQTDGDIEYCFRYAYHP